jgi:hypothetical protein
MRATRSTREMSEFNMSAEHQFTVEHYMDLVRDLETQGYEIANFSTVQPTARHLILRHDVDFDLGLAVQMASSEAQAGWSATYYVLLRTEFYNPFSAAGTNFIQELLRLGHTVGLHFDGSLYSADQAGMASAIKAECDTLATITRQPVTTFSFHRPHSDLLDHGFEVDGLINAYDKRFFSRIGYCSDSRGGWHHGHPLDHPSITSGHALQLLTHPVWWVEPGEDPQSKCAGLLDRRNKFLDQELALNCKSYMPQSQL